MLGSGSLSLDAVHGRAAYRSWAPRWAAYLALQAAARHPEVVSAVVLDRFTDSDRMAGKLLSVSKLTGLAYRAGASGPSPPAVAITGPASEREFCGQGVGK